MAEQKENRNPKRPHENDENAETDDEQPQRKQQNGDEEAVLEAEPNGITNICFELLDRIFDTLDMISLFNVAQTCKRLQIAAAAKFETKFANQYFNFDLKTKKKYFAFLRCFGSKLSRLRVKSSSTNARYENFVDQYINQYCANSLIYISFERKHEFSNDAFKNPFTYVEIINAIDCNLTKQLPNFVKWFPNVNQLNIRNFSIDSHSEFSSVSFPHLKHLTIHIAGSKYSGVRKYPGIGFEKLLRANQQLQCLELSTDYTYPLEMYRLVKMIK